MGHRRWFKVFSEKWLRGSMRDTSAERRGIWIDLLALASDGYYGAEGIIKLADGGGLTDKQIARILSLSAEQWATAKDFFTSENMILVEPDNTITIVNWRKYQSEFERQKPYRE